MCDIISSGRSLGCDLTQGGIEEIYFFNHLPDAFTVTNGVADGIDVGVTAVYKYEIKGDGNTFTESVVVDKKAGTKVNTQTLVAQLHKVDNATNVELEKLLVGKVSAVYKDRNGLYRWIASQSFNITSTAELVTGGAKTDFNGYNVTLVAETLNLAPGLDATTVTAFLALVA